MDSTRNNWFSNWIFHSFSVTAEGLALYRVFVALFILALLIPSTEIYRFLGSLPPDFYNPPPGPMGFFGDFPPVEVFYTIHLVLIVSTLSLLAGFKTRYSSFSVAICFLILKGFFYSVGKINHDLLIAMVPLVMAFSGWGKAFSADSYLNAKSIRSREVQSWPLVLLALMIGFMMFTAGFPKILGGWLDLESQATYGHAINQFFGNNRQDLLAAYAIQIENSIAWELLDYGTVLFETGFLLAIFHPKTTKIFICFAIIFHFSTMVMLNIAFLPNMLAYAAFLNWSFIHQKVEGKILSNRSDSLIVLLTGFVILLILVLLARYLGLPSLNSDLRISEFYILITALPIALYYLGTQLYKSVRRWSQG